MATRDQAKKAIEQHEDELAGFENVVGIGTSGEGDDASIALYVSALPEDADALPEYVELSEGDGTSRVEVTVEEVGPLTPEAAPDDGFTVE